MSENQATGTEAYCGDCGKLFHRNPWSLYWCDECTELRENEPSVVPAPAPFQVSYYHGGWGEDVGIHCSTFVETVLTFKKVSIETRGLTPIFIHGVSAAVKRKLGAQ